jgi:putative N6-adenine-specific DNA methylase
VTHQIFAVCAPGLEPVLLAEVQALGCKGTAGAGGVEIDGTLRDVARLNLWLRTASRVLVRLGTVKATAFPELVRKASALPWELYLRPGAKAALRVTCRKSRLYHSGAVAERLHAAMEARLGAKVQAQKSASEDEEGEDAQLVVARFDRDVCTVSADSSGALLHRRGYRLAQSQAPLRETLAAAVLLAAGYTGSEPLLDPLCGSATIPIEAALIARRRAPGLERAFAFQGWPGYDASRYRALLARAREGELVRAPAPIAASDADAAAIRAARENARRAGTAEDLRIEQVALRDAHPPPGPGLIATNPPYGVRVRADLARLYADLGDLGRRCGYRIAALVPDRRPTERARVHWERALRTQNGGVRVELLVAV